MYKPEQKNAHLLWLVMAGFAMTALAAYFACIAVQSYRWIFQLVIVLAVSAALFLWSRYSLTWFCYVLRQQEDGGEELVVYKGQGKKEGVMEAVLPLSSLVETVPVRRREPVGKKEPKKNWKAYARARYIGCDCYDYTRTFLWQDAVMYIFHYGGTHLALLMEPDGGPIRRDTTAYGNSTE